MGNQVVTQAVASAKTTLDPHQTIEEFALFNADGTPRTGRDTIFAPVTTATAIGTAAKVTSSDEPDANTLVPIIFTSGNSANSPTVAFNGGTARAIQLGGTAVTGAKCAIAAGGVVLCWFDGTILHLVGTYT